MSNIIVRNNTCNNNINDRFQHIQCNRCDLIIYVLFNGIFKYTQIFVYIL